MKKIFTLILFCAPMLCLSQVNVQGYWKLSAVKLLRLEADQTFHLTKGAYHHYGTYRVDQFDGKSYLSLAFETTTIDYEIQSFSTDRMEIVDARNQEIITARRVDVPREDDITETDKEADVYQEEKQENPYLKNHYRNLYPDNQFFLSIGGSGGLSFPSGLYAKSTSEKIGNVQEDFSTTFLFSYSGGIQLGYQVSYEFYAGIGGNYNVTGFQANRQASTTDPKYQFDATSSQSAKYTYSSIEIPIWASYRLHDKWVVEAGAIASLPIRSTSEAVFSGENTVKINGEVDDRTSYTSDDYSVKYPDLLEKYAMGGYVSIQRRLTKHFLFTLSYKYIEEYMQFNEGLISNNSVQAGLRLQIF